MARVRRRRGTRRLARQKKDWVVGPWQVDRDQPIGPAGTQYYTLIDGVELEEKDDRLTVLRVVGDIWTIPTDTTTNMSLGGALFWHGIKVFETDEAGLILPLNFLDPLAADANWMYLRVGYTVWAQLDVGGGARALAQVQSDSKHYYSNSGWGGDHIDIQVKRKLQGNEVLLLAMGLGVPDRPYDSTAANTTAAYHAIFVRTLVGNL